MICIGAELSPDWNVISAISNIIMAAIAFGALWYSIKQNRDFKKQREEDERGRVSFSIIIVDEVYILKIENIGNRNVYNMQLSINNEFLNKIPVPSIKDHFTKSTSKINHIPRHSSKQFVISWKEGVDKSCDEVINKLKHEKIIIKGKYNDKYTIDECFTMDEFTSSFHFEDPIIKALTTISESIKKSNK